MQRLGLFGGSFDPVHNGHLALARCALEQATLDRVWLIPAAVQPHKPRGPVAPDADRLAMLRLAVAGEPRLEASTLELDRGGMSYTIDTLRAARAAAPGAALLLLMGADTLHDLPQWREPGAVLALATPLVTARPGEPEPNFTALAGLVPPDRLAEVRRLTLRVPPHDISSSEVRRRVAEGRTLEGLVPDAVAHYIAERGLYR